MEIQVAELVKKIKTMVSVFRVTSEIQDNFHGKIGITINNGKPNIIEVVKETVKIN